MSISRTEFEAYHEDPRSNRCNHCGRNLHQYPRWFMAISRSGSMYAHCSLECCERTMTELGSYSHHYTVYTPPNRTGKIMLIASICTLLFALWVLWQRIGDVAIGGTVP